MNLAKYGKATCPTCKGRGVLQRKSATGIVGRTQSCLACFATGVVEAWRICGKCHEWRASCACEKANGHQARVFKRQPVTIIDVKAEVVEEIAVPVTAQIAPPAPVSKKERRGEGKKKGGAI